MRISEETRSESTRGVLAKAVSGEFRFDGLLCCDIGAVRINADRHDVVGNLESLIMGSKWSELAGFQEFDVESDMVIIRAFRNSYNDFIIAIWISYLEFTVPDWIEKVIVVPDDQKGALGVLFEGKWKKF